MIMDKCEIVPYNMPSLEIECAPKSREEVMREIEELQRQAYEEGFAAGEKAGFEVGGSKAAVLIERLENMIKEVSDFKSTLVADLEGQVVDLAIAMARKVTGEEIRTRPEVIITVVKEALKRLQRTGTITVRVNPAIYELFLKRKSEFTELHEDIVFDVNAHVSVTGPMVISNTEEVVANIDELIDNIVAVIKSGVGSSTEERGEGDITAHDDEPEEGDGDGAGLQ